MHVTQMAARNCNPEVSRLCGRACVSWAKRCKDDPPDPPVPGRAPRGGAGGGGGRKEPNCTPGRTRKCGKACISLARNCKIDGTRGTACAAAGAPVGRRQFDQQLLDVATQARLNANRARFGTARRARLEKIAFEALLKAAQAVRPAHACGRAEARRVALREEARLLRAAQQQQQQEDDYETGAI
jgi:hypothetical protein